MLTFFRGLYLGGFLITWVLTTRRLIRHYGSTGWDRVGDVVSGLLVGLLWPVVPLSWLLAKRPWSKASTR